jgi:cytochrome b561
MVDLNYYHAWYKLAPFIHKSIGILLFFLMLFRIIWRVINVTPEAIFTHTKQERVLGSLMHKALYITVFCVIISGYLISTADGKPISVFGIFNIPASIVLIPNQEDIAGIIHFFLALLLIFMSIVHGLAAFKHHLIDKDNTLKRMLGKS